MKNDMPLLLKLINITSTMIVSAIYLLACVNYLKDFAKATSATNAVMVGLALVCLSVKIFDIWITKRRPKK